MSFDVISSEGCWQEGPMVRGGDYIFCQTWHIVDSRRATYLSGLGYQRVQHDSCRRAAAG